MSREFVDTHTATTVMMTTMMINIYASPHSCQLIPHDFMKLSNTYVM